MGLPGRGEGPGAEAFSQNGLMMVTPENKRKVYGVLVCIRKKVPLLLGLIMDFMGTRAEATKLKGMVNSIPGRKCKFYTHALESRHERKSKMTVRGKGLSVGRVLQGRVAHRWAGR